MVDCPAHQLSNGSAHTLRFTRQQLVSLVIDEHLNPAI